MLIWNNVILNNEPNNIGLSFHITIKCHNTKTSNEQKIKQKKFTAETKNTE